MKLIRQGDLFLPDMENLSSSQHQAIREQPPRKGKGPTPMSHHHSDLRTTILRMIMYFDVFRHPLTLPELVRFIDPDQPKLVTMEVDALVEGRLLARQDAFVFRSGMEDMVLRRQIRTRAAEKIWPRARRAAAWLYRIPQVRGLLVTGSLSKNSTQYQDDIDFMVLVEPGQVWTLKTLLQGVRRAMPAGVRECFCTNYLLDISKPIVDDRNFFTAIEIATAMPMAGRNATLQFLEANHHWVRHFVPGFEWSIERARNMAPDSPSRLRVPNSSWLEKRAMSLWSHYWDRKYHWLDPVTRDRRFKRRPEIATNHLHDFQGYVLDEVQHRLTPLGVDLPSFPGSE
jgi:hypothetical protein